MYSLYLTYVCINRSGVNGVNIVIFPYMGLFRYILPRISVIISEGFNMKITLPGRKQKKRCFLKNLAFSFYY